MARCSHLFFLQKIRRKLLLIFDGLLKICGYLNNFSSLFLARSLFYKLLLIRNNRIDIIFFWSQNFFKLKTFLVFSKIIQFSWNGLETALQHKFWQGLSFFSLRGGLLFLLLLHLYSQKKTQQFVHIKFWPNSSENQAIEHCQSITLFRNMFDIISGKTKVPLIFFNITDQRMQLQFLQGCD